MTYLASPIQDSPVISENAASDIPDVRGKAVAFDENGNFVLCSAAGQTALGLALVTNDTPVLQGNPVDIQIKDIGLALAGAVIAKGDELTTDASGALVPAAAGQAVCAIALQAAATAGAFVQVLLCKYPKAAS